MTYLNVDIIVSITKLTSKIEIKMYQWIKIKHFSVMFILCGFTQGCQNRDPT